MKYQHDFLQVNDQFLFEDDATELAELLAADNDLFEINSPYYSDLN